MFNKHCEHQCHHDHERSHFGHRGRHHHHHGRHAMFHALAERADFVFHMAGRHGGEGPFGGRGGRGGPFGPGGRPPFLRGRKFGADELQLLLLVLLKENASYGYELIKRLEEKSGGFYKPSPGVIYPALTWLEDVSYVTVQQEGTRKRYALAPEGENWLNENQAQADAMMERLAQFARQMDSMAEAMREEPADFAPELREAVHTLRHQIHAHHHSTLEVQRQVAAILETAIEELKKIGR
ncbi:hypothetical protein TUM12370_33920 [Salmonella enterica subsp. enterica serovar Choleraesuis]|nr:hypothetical protein TUM12370_33920 [Salmonella enterica subsp. enterica serovar Choleraesuis]